MPEIMFCRCTLILFFSFLQIQDQINCFIFTPKQTSILNEMSWKVKLRFLNNLILPKDRKRVVSIQALTLTQKRPVYNEYSKRNVDLEALMWRQRNVQAAQKLKRNVAIEYLIKSPANYNNVPHIMKHNEKMPKAMIRHNEIRTKMADHVKNDDESSMSFEETPVSKHDWDFEAMGVHDGLQTDHKDNQRHFNRRQGSEVTTLTAHHEDEAKTEKDMKLKLFRLMYDTVKDNDELVRKAENIKKDYDNSAYFEIGFVMGAITDKVNTMSDVALTVERLYDEWKPIEHVNAYEQIANLAIEINHLIDVLESVYKKMTKV